MSITVQNRFLRVRDFVGEGKASAILQETLELSGQYPDVERVVALHAVPRNVEAVAEDGRVAVRGALDLRLLYAAYAPGSEGQAAEDDADQTTAPPRLVLAEFPGAASFALAVEVAGCAGAHKARAMVTVESVGASLVTRRRLGLDVALVAAVEVHEDQEVRAGVEVTVVPPERARAVRETVHVEHLAAEGVSRPSLELSLALPPEEPAVAEVLWVVPRHHHLMGRTGDGKGFVEGLVDVDVVYLTSDPSSPVNAFTWSDAHRFAFTFDLPGARPGMTLHPELDFEQATGVADGERVLTVTVSSQLRVTVRHALDLPILTDTVSESGEQLDLLRRTVRFPHHLAETHFERAVGGVISLPPSRPPLDRVCWATASFVPDGVAVEEDRVVVEGDLSLGLLYLAGGAECPAYHADFPRALRFSHAADLPGIRPGMTALARVFVRAVSVRPLDPETLQVDVAVHLVVRGMKVVQAEVVTDCVVVSPCPPGTTLRMVIVQPGDTLWLLSRRYGVPLDALIRANPQIQNPDLIYPGQRIRIPCAPVNLPKDP